MCPDINSGLCVVAHLGRRQGFGHTGRPDVVVPLCEAPGMATFVLIHGGGGSSWDWHLLGPELTGRGHHVVVPELPRPAALT